MLRPKGRNSLSFELLQFGRHLVYAEGTKTEPYYINSIKKKIANKYNCRQNDIEIINAGDGKSYNTTGLVNYVKKDVDSRLEKNEIINHIWIFFDKDDFPINKFNEAVNMIQEMNNSSKRNEDGFYYDVRTNISWHSCFSNEAFELWYCLYFDKCSEKMERSEYLSFLNERLSSRYYKNKEDMHQFLMLNGGSLDAAIINAKELYENNGLNNPSTNVFVFAEYFKSYMK